MPEHIRSRLGDSTGVGSILQRPPQRESIERQQYHEAEPYAGGDARQQRRDLRRGKGLISKLRKSRLNPWLAKNAIAIPGTTRS
jgi:hypothetical protein